VDPSLFGRGVVSVGCAGVQLVNVCLVLGVDAENVKGFQ